MWLGSLLLCIVPHDDTTTVYATCLEVNNVFDGEQYRFSQLIIWDAGDCRDWRMVAKSGRPRFRWSTGEWEAEWIEKGRVIRVLAPHFLETHTQYDREVCERDYCLECDRKKLIERREDAFEVWNGRKP